MCVERKLCSLVIVSLNMDLTHRIMDGWRDSLNGVMDDNSIMMIMVAMVAMMILLMLLTMLSLFVCYYINES